MCLGPLLSSWRSNATLNHIKNVSDNIAVEAKGSQLAYTFKAKLLSQYQLQTTTNLPTFQLDTLVFLRATMKLVSSN